MGKGLKTPGAEPAAVPLTPFERDLAEFLGVAPSSGEREPTRDHVTFRAADAATPLEAADDLVRHLRAGNKARAHLSRDVRVKARTHVSYSGAVTVRVSWQGDRFRTIRFSSCADGLLLASHNVDGGRDLSQLLHDWLTASNRFADVRWLTREQFLAGEPGQPTPR